MPRSRMAMIHSKNTFKLVMQLESKNKKETKHLGEGKEKCVK